MEKGYKVAYEGGEGSIIIKKSKFIATVMPVDNEDAAIEFIEMIKKKYWDATHNCYAYVIGDNNESQRCSDDGEPSGTAGRPMLDVLIGEEIHNIVVVVTRYFGGTLLGTGGLVRAYQEATKEGIKQSNIIEKYLGKKLLISTDYNGIGKIQYVLAQLEIHTLDIEYTDIVNVVVIATIEKINRLEKKVIEVTSGKAKITMLKECFFADLAGNIILYE